jgi:stage II sporulation protein D
VPLPPGVQTLAVMSRRIASLVFVSLAASTLFGQSTITDVDLARLSAARAVTVRALARGPATRIPLEVYVARVLAGEGEPGAPDATQEALAIAIRTFAIFNAGRHQRDGFDLCDTTHCQVLRAATAASRRAALATAGRILTYRGAPAEIFYSASCGGRTESASAVWPRSNLRYLRSVDDDVHDDDETWMIDVTLAAAQGALRRSGFEGSLKDVEVTDRSESGRVARLRLSGMRPDEITGDQFRMAIGPTEVRSTAFTVDKRGNTLRFTGRGFGHGVGMCVIGAGRRARRGENVQQILARYYSGLAIGTVGDVPATLTAAPPPAVPAVTARGVTVRVPRSSAITPAELQRVATRARESLSKTLGGAAAPIAVELHETLDGFRSVTGKPWWVSAVVSGSTIDLAPAAVLAQRGGIEETLRVAIAELLLTQTLADRPAWVRVGGARFLSKPLPAGATSERSAERVRCPADAELTLAISAAAQRDAESRAETCFARAYARSNDWRSVR